MRNKVGAVFLFFWNSVYSVTASYVFVHPRVSSAVTSIQTGGRWLTRKGWLKMDSSVKRYVDEMLVCFSVM